MNEVEAKSLLSGAPHTLATLSDDELVAMISNADVKTINGRSGVNYQIELNVFRDQKPEGDLRIIGAIDDGGWRAF